MSETAFPPRGTTANPGGYEKTDQKSMFGSGVGGDPLRLGSPEFPSSPTLITIYVDGQAGSDKHGKGTQDKPYQSLPKAAQYIPTIIPPLTFYFIKTKGVLPPLPVNYTLPAWKAPQAIVFANFGLPIVLAGAVTIYSDPVPVPLSPASDAVIQADDVLSVAADPLTGNQTITLKAARASWGTNGLRSKKVFGPSVDDFHPVVVYANTTTTISLTTPDSVDPNTDPEIYPLTVSNPGATLSGADDSSSAILQAINVDSLGIYNIDFDLSDAGFNSLFCDGNCQLMIGMCDAPDLVFQNMAPEQTRVISSYCTGFPFFASTGAGTFFNRSLFDTCVTSFPFLGYQSAPVLSFHNCVFDGCDPIEPVFAIDVFQPQAVDNFNMDGCLVKNGTGDGLIYHGATGLISNCDFSDNAGNGIACNQGAGFLRLENVGSKTPNLGGFGVAITGPVQVSADTATTSNAHPLTGATNDVSVGSVGAKSWAQVAAANIPDFTGANATGARALHQ